MQEAEAGVVVQIFFGIGCMLGQFIAPAAAVWTDVSPFFRSWFSCQAPVQHALALLRFCSNLRLPVGAQPCNALSLTSASGTSSNILCPRADHLAAVRGGRNCRGGQHRRRRCHTARDRLGSAAGEAVHGAAGRGTQCRRLRK